MTQLAGGLGNQMFQYAAGRALADRLGVDLGLDLRALRVADSRAYGLDAFGIRAVPVADDDLEGVSGPSGWRWAARHGWRALIRRALGSPRRRLHAIVHQGIEYTDALTHAGPDTWLCGWWQSERYFVSIADRIRADLTMQQRSPRLADAERRIRALTFPVAVHIRRGDYAHVASTKAYHGLCSIEYYRRGMDRVRAHRPDATFLFFSDEPEWVAQAFQPDPACLMSGTAGDRPQDDLHLMTRCRGHIIANSTFSWWGAWLAASEFVVAPERWFQAPGLEATDIVPARWLRL